MMVINSAGELSDKVGTELGVSEWHKVTQDQIDKFASATGDYQWIHTNPEKCAEESPYHTTIAHGYLTLSLAPFFLAQIFRVEGQSMAINYGMEKVRFMSHVPVDSNLRMRIILKDLHVRPSVSKVTIKLVFEIEGGKKAVCQAESILMIR